MTRALGDLFTKQIESGVIPDPFVSDVCELGEEERAYLVIASDGVNISFFLLLFFVFSFYQKYKVLISFF